LKNRIEYLDSLRGIAAFSVVIFHCMISFNIFHSANYKADYRNGFIKFITESPLKVLWSGQEAVLLFFVLSGFVLSISFLKGKNNNYNIFLARRFARIYIPYIIVMLVSVVLASIFMNFKDIDGLSSTFDNRWDHAVTWKSILAYIFMINYDTANVNGVVWTLYHEMRISVMFPILMMIVIKWKALKSLLVSCILLSASWLTLMLISKYSTGTISFIASDFSNTVFYTAFFVFGAILSKYRTEVSNYISRLNPLIKLFMFVISMILMSARWVGVVSPILPGYIQDLTAGAGIVILFCVALSSSFAQSVLMSKPLLWLGKISFSLYLIHILVLLLLVNLFGSYIGVGVIWLTPIASLPVAALVYKFVEEPAIKIGRNWTSVLKNRDSKIKNAKTRAV